MKIANPKKILDPYEWLPKYGESAVSFHSSNLDTVIEITYEQIRENPDGTTAAQHFRRNIIFHYVRYFLRLPFPENLSFEYVGNPEDFKLGDLMEFEKSDLIAQNAHAWHLATTSASVPNFRHFSIQFLSENITFHIVTKEVSLSEASPITKLNING